MAVLTNEGDEIRGERLICIYRKRSAEFLVPQTSGHRAIRTVVKGLPARAIIDKLWRLTQPQGL